MTKREIGMSSVRTGTEVDEATGKGEKGEARDDELQGVVRDRVYVRYFEGVRSAFLDHFPKADRTKETLR
jgi:hypothetical protein